MQIPIQSYTDHKESHKHDTTKGTNKAPLTNLKEMEIYIWPDKEFKIIILKISEMPKNTNRQQNESKKIYITNKKLNKEIETIKKKNRNLGSEKYKNCTEKFSRVLNSSFNHIEEIIS